jgi:hypothetical protein
VKYKRAAPWEIKYFGHLCAVLDDAHASLGVLLLADEPGQTILVSREHVWMYPRKYDSKETKEIRQS